MHEYAGAGGGGRGGQPDNGDFTTVQRLDRPITPALTAQDAFFEFLFSGADVKYADLKAKATAQEPLPADSLLWKLPKVILSPHVSGFTPLYDERAMTLFAENLRRYVNDEPLLNVVDLSKGY